jgi:hypothetical protein
MQIFQPGTTMSGLTFNYDVFGPGTNTGLLPSDGGTGTTFDDVTIKNTLFLDTASMDILNINPVHGWDLNNDTIVATRGAFQIPGNGPNTMTNVIKYGGSVYAPGGSWTTSGNIWYGGDPLPGDSAHFNPGFASDPTRTPRAGTLPSIDSLRAASFAPSTTAKGSPLHSWSALLEWIDSLNELH